MNTSPEQLAPAQNAIQ
ncbi:unnamed protein product, partial [Didymodactylos carnosus]